MFVFQVKPLIKRFNFNDFFLHFIKEDPLTIITIIHSQLVNFQIIITLSIRIQNSSNLQLNSIFINLIHLFLMIFNFRNHLNCFINLNFIIAINLSSYLVLLLFIDFGSITILNHLIVILNLNYFPLSLEVFI